MRVGISSWWFNRGQAVVGRHLRSAFDSLGHETRVLARPTRGGNIRPAFIDRTGVWDQPGVTEASDYLIPERELLDWARETGIEVACFDQNYQFDEIAALRASGVRTVGRFVWEQFSAEHVEGAKRAFDVVYSMHAAERERYAGLGIESPRVHWGVHPELLEFPAPPKEKGLVRFMFPGGFMSKRKPIGPVLEAFRQTRDERFRLIVKAQVDRKAPKVEKAAKRDSRIELITEDLPTDEHLRLFASAHVSLAPSRWEGLGLHLYEAMAFAIPTVVNDSAPMNEVVRDGENGLLVRPVPDGEAKSGIPAYGVDPADLAAAIERLGDDALLARLTAGTRAAREAWNWERTKGDLAALLERVA
ncbi:MAG TPA: glycosyltransferase family 4 protein [Solirubrobacterales bacterium]